MLIGDGVYGYGFRIKRNIKFEYFWKQKIHSKYTTVLVTNESKTSQTCVFCFSTIVHPKQQVIIKGKKFTKMLTVPLCTSTPSVFP
jgi:hypothetical protein